MSRLMVIGCGGVASVAIHKVCQNDGVFDELMIASRTKAKCDALKEKLEGTTKTKITTAQIDADDRKKLFPGDLPEKPVRSRLISVVKRAEQTQQKRLRRHLPKLHHARVHRFIIVHSHILISAQIKGNILRYWA